MNLEQVKELLPARILEIAKAIGLPATQRLVEKLGGTTWTPAQGVRQLGVVRNEALADIIGNDAARILAERWANVPIYVPRCEAALQRLRDLEINAQFEQGVREGVGAKTLVAELARSYQLSSEC